MPTAMATIEHATQLLDFSQKLDITLLDSVVSCFYMAQGPQVDTYFLFTLHILNEQILEIQPKVPLTEGYFFASSAKNGRPDLDSTQTAPWRLDESWYYTRVLKQPTDKGTLWVTISAVFRGLVFLRPCFEFFSSISRSKYSKQWSRHDGKFSLQNNVKVSPAGFTTSLSEEICIFRALRVNLFWKTCWRCRFKGGFSLVFSGIKKYIVGLIIKISSEAELLEVWLFFEVWFCFRIYLSLLSEL